ncbi:MAG: T9SS type A sorting domain-containing protein, partial [Bacteroidia bacterium]|nr:T9SS type A sorting domain-containing protein [Bacteroidia bacterium]
LRSLAVAPSDTSVIYAATYNDIYSRVNKDSSWTNITKGLPANSITYIAVHPDTADSVWITFSGYNDTVKVYLSPNGGDSWINVSGSLPNIPINCIVCENSKYHDLYIGTDLGVYYTNDTLTDWVAYNNRLPNVIVNELEIHESSGQLKAATYGRGLWQTDLVSYNRPITDASINEIQEPSGTSCLDSIDPIVVLRNYGIDTLLNADIYYQLDSDSVFIYSWSGQLPTELKEEIQLPGLSASLGNHSFKVFVSNPNGGVDENYSNDTLVQIFTITGVISSFPYYEDFENNDGGWFTDEDDNFGGPANNTWEWGIPTGPDLDTANSGQKAWGTNLSGAYVNRTAAYLVSPCFDISLLQEPVFEFFMAFEIENNWDAAYVEYSVDYGDNWNKLGDANDPNWYNSSLVGNGSSTGLLCTGAQWEGIDSVSKIMTKYYRSLAPVKGESNLLIRIVMSSDHFVTYDGMVVDDIRIYDAADSSKSPQANFSAKVIEACENDSIEFSDESLFTPISWLWSFQGGSPGSDTIQYPIISYDSSGTYDVTLIVSNALGSDTIVKSTYITVNENPSILIGITDVTCFGDTTGYIDLNVTGGTPPYYYWWSNGKISQDLPDVAVGNYYVTISDAKNCKVLKSATVNEPDKMKMVWQKKDIVCKDSVGYIDVIASGGTNIFSYLWSNGAIDSINTGLTAGLYYLTILDGNKCELQDTIRILQLNTNILLSKTDIDCYEENIGSATVKVSDNSPPYSYFWSNSDSVSSIDSLYSGTYIVSVINSDNCLSIDSITILQPESIFVDVVLDDISCNGFNDGSISVSTYGGVSPYIYAWSQGGSVPDLLNLLPGDYTLTVIDNNDCSKNWNYNIDEPDTISIVYYVDSANYSMADGSINVSVFGGTTPYSYAWSSSSTAANLDSVYGGVFGLLVNDLNGCEDSVVIIIPTLYQLLIANAGKDSIYCIGDTIVLGAAPSATGGAPPYSYNWEIKCCSTFVKFPGPSLDDSTQSNPVIVNIPKFEPDSFAYVLTVTDSVGNVAIDTVNLMVAGTYFDTSAIYEFSIFQGDSIRLAVSASLVYDPITYLWNPTDGLSDSTTGRPWASPDTTTLYSLTETDPGGCQLVQTALVTVFGVGIKENFGNFIGLNIYPNPNLGKFVLEIELQGKAEFQIQLTSINGQIIYSESVDTSFYKKEIDFSGYAKGVYTLKVVSDGGVVYRKIVYQ